MFTGLVEALGKVHRLDREGVLAVQREHLVEPHHMGTG